METLPQRFYSRKSEEVAEDLLGNIFVKGRMRGMVVETEAYYGEEDPASHASGGKTERNEIMYGEAGRLYVYICYGLYHLLNITTRNQGKPGAVLIRALKPLEGLKFMQENRQVADKIELTNGPGKLTEALGIDKSFNGTDVTKENSDIQVVKGEPPEDVEKGRRIGINEGEERELRFYIKGCEWVSR